MTLGLPAGPTAWRLALRHHRRGCCRRLTGRHRHIQGLGENRAVHALRVGHDRTGRRDRRQFDRRVVVDQIRDRCQPVDLRGGRRRNRLDIRSSTSTSSTIHPRQLRRRSRRRRCHRRQRRRPATSHRQRRDRRRRARQRLHRPQAPVRLRQPAVRVASPVGAVLEELPDAAAATGRLLPHSARTTPAGRVRRAPRSTCESLGCRDRSEARRCSARRACRLRRKSRGLNTGSAAGALVSRQRRRQPRHQCASQPHRARSPVRPPSPSLYRQVWPAA